jgi:hypothetical protein
MTNKRKVIIYTGKGGAIDALLSLTEAMCKYINLSEEETVTRLKEKRENLEKNLEEGIYKISGEGNEFVTYCGSYY